MDAATYTVHVHVHACVYLYILYFACVHNFLNNYTFYCCGLIISSFKCFMGSGVSFNRKLNFSFSGNIPYFSFVATHLAGVLNISSM